MVRCYRVGKQQEKDKDTVTGTMRRRPLVITLSTPELARQLCSYGAGKKYLVDNVVYWANPDLIQSDRLANQAARKFRFRNSNRDSRSSTLPDRTTKSLTDPKPPVKAAQLPVESTQKSQFQYKGSERQQMDGFLVQFNSPENKKRRADERQRTKEIQEEERTAAVQAAASLNKTLSVDSVDSSASAEKQGFCM